MSSPLYQQVYDHCPEKNMEREILIALALFANSRDQSIWFRVDTLTQRVCKSERRVVEALKHLVRTGRLICEAGAGPHEYDLYRIVIPDEKATPEVVKAARAAHPQTVADAPRYSKRKSKNPKQINHAAPRKSGAAARTLNISCEIETDISCSVYPPQPIFFILDLPGMSTEAPGMSTLSHEMSVSNPAQACATNENPAPIFTIISSITKEVVIDLASDPGAGEALEAELVQPGCDNDDFLQELETETPNTENQNPTLEAWDDQDDLLLGLTPDGVVPDSTNGESDAPELTENSGNGERDDVEDTSSEQVPPARRAVRLKPGDEAYRTLEALSGGSNRTPHLPGLLRETGANGVSRGLWLALTLPEIIEAREDAKKRHLQGNGAFRTILFHNLDNLALTGRLEGVPITPRASGGAFGAATAVFPGQALGGTRAADRFPEQARVLLDNTWLGVVHAIAPDLSRTVTLQLDEGRRVMLPSREVGVRLKAAQDAQPAPESVSAFAPGQCWQAKRGGEHLSVSARDGVNFTMSDGRTLPMLALTRDFTHVQN